MTNPIDVMTYHQVKQVAKQAVEIAGHLKTELEGSLLAQWIMAKRMGGSVTITEAEMLAAQDGRLQVMQDKENKAYIFIALEPSQAEAVDVAEAAKGLAPDPNYVADTDNAGVEGEKIEDIPGAV